MTKQPKYEWSDDCPKGGEHHVKFNGGNPVCLKCGNYQPDGQVVLPATRNEDGTFTVHVPGESA